jgi:hypothetical protein
MFQEGRQIHHPALHPPFSDSVSAFPSISTTISEAAKSLLDSGDAEQN